MRADIDLAFGVRDARDMHPVLDEFTRFMYDAHGCVDHVDVPSRAWIYRVFLLRNTLQVDVAVAPAPDFGARQVTTRAFHAAADGLQREIEIANSELGTRIRPVLKEIASQLVGGADDLDAVFARREPVA